MNSKTNSTAKENNMGQHYYRFSDYGTEPADLIARTHTESWQMGDRQEGVSCCRSISGLLTWAADHSANIDMAQLDVVEGEELGEDMDADNNVDAVRINISAVVETVEIERAEIIRLATANNEWAVPVAEKCDDLGIDG